MTTDREEILDALRVVQDPEMGFGVVDLGLIYRAEEVGDAIEVDFTLTYPGCPAGEQICMDLAMELRKRFPEKEARVALVWEPMWGPDRMSEALRVEMGFPI